MAEGDHYPAEWPGSRTTAPAGMSSAGKRARQSPNVARLASNDGEAIDAKALEVETPGVKTLPKAAKSDGRWLARQGVIPSPPEFLERRFLNCPF